MKQRTLLILSIFFLAAFMMIAWTEDVQSASTPDGFDKYLVYMAAGVYDPADPDFVPPSGDFFQREIMGRTDEEIEEDKDNAIAFFAERFGIDVEDPASGVMFISFMLDPRNEYRAYTISRAGVPPSGYVVRDGGYMVSVMNPAGIDLGGEFAGTHVPMGSIVVFGDYNIKRGKQKHGHRHGHGKNKNIIIHYQSLLPILPPNDLGVMPFICEITSEWGTGRAQGISASITLGDGRTHANIRNVLTFPGLGEVPEG